MKKTKTYLYSAAVLMIFAVFLGLLRKSVAAQTSDEAMLALKENNIQMTDSLGNSETIEYVSNDTPKSTQNTDNFQQDLAETAINSPESEQATEKKTVKELMWFKDGDSVFEKLSTAVVTDVLTGQSFTVIRKGGTNHADVEPLTAEDTKIMKSIYGGSWSWDRRAIWIEIDGQLYAASMNGMPHGKEIVIDNNFNGHFCIHFTGSKTHATNRVDAAHQAAIKVALNTAP